jgi:hypothetical protein
MLDDIDKGFCLFAMQISSNMAKISLHFECHGSGCTPPIGKAKYQIHVLGNKLEVKFLNFKFKTANTKQERQSSSLTLYTNVSS